MLLQALAHPHLDYCQSALAKPSAAATASVRRMYNKTARVAVWGLRALWRPRREEVEAGQLLRTAPALAQTRWLEWEQRRAALMASVTARIFHTEEPAVLRALLPQVTDALLHDRKLRSHTKGCVVTFINFIGRIRAPGRQHFGIPFVFT